MPILNRFTCLMKGASRWLYFSSVRYVKIRNSGGSSGTHFRRSCGTGTAKTGWTSMKRYSNLPCLTSIRSLIS